MDNNSSAVHRPDISPAAAQVQIKPEPGVTRDWGTSLLAKSRQASDAWIVLIVFAATALLMCGSWTFLGPGSRTEDGSDYKAYYEPVARSIVAHGRPLDADGGPATRYAPGYPLILALLFWIAGATGMPELRLLQGFALFGTAISGVFLFVLARSVWPAWAALVAPILWATCPFVMWMSGLESSEVAFCAVFFAAVYCVWTASSQTEPSPFRCVLSGLLIGGAMLIRHIAIGCGFLMAAWMLFGGPRPHALRSRVVPAMLLMLGNLAVVMPWQAWVYHRSGQLILLSDARGPVLSIRDGLTYGTNLKGFRKPLPLSSDVEAVMRSVQARYDDLESVGDIGRVLAEQARVRPMGVVKLILLKASRSWYGTDSHRLEAQILTLQALYLVPIALGGIMAWTYAKSSRRLLMLLVPLYRLLLGNHDHRFVYRAIYGSCARVDFRSRARCGRRSAPAVHKVSVDAEQPVNTPGSLVRVPLVTVVLPIRNEGHYVTAGLQRILDQDYPPDRMEIIVADGMSTDGTREAVAALQRTDSRIQMVDNPGRIVSTGLNAALLRANGDIIVRVDGHCEVGRSYVSRAVAHLRDPTVAAVGGPLKTVGETPLARAIAAAMSSRFGVGNSMFRVGSSVPQFVDTVAFPAYPRRAIDLAGSFDEELVRNQDDEYSYRLRALGFRILLAPDLQAVYYSRSALRSLWSQYFQYGYWKVRVMQKHPGQMRPRQFVPPLFVAAVLTSVAIALTVPSGKLALAAVVVPYLVANVAASVLVARAPGTGNREGVRFWRLLAILPPTFAVLHLAYGAGFLLGLVKFSSRWGGRLQAAELSSAQEAAKSFASRQR